MRIRQHFRDTDAWEARHAGDDEFEYFSTVWMKSHYPDAYQKSEDEGWCADDSEFEPYYNEYLSEKKQKYVDYLESFLDD